MIDLDAAERFIWTNARLIERHRFAHLFKDAPAEPVVEALRPYQNPDGGFGNALEPDLRTPTSQPIAVNSALEDLDEAGSFGDPMVERACDWLVTIQHPDGGVPFVLTTAAPHPRAPWWEIGDEEPPSSALVTGLIVATLQHNGSEHPFLAPAAELCWRAVEDSPLTSPYEARALLRFLDSAPERSRAEAAVDALAPRLMSAGVVELDPDASGEVHFPLDFAPWPDVPSRRLFEPAVIETHLDALERGQQDDGGWRFNWPAWAPAPEADWRGWVTLHALKVLRANGRL
jgi:prenyltransferase/squalene oxidase-like repeat protein